MVWDTSAESSTTTIGKIVLIDNPGVHIHGNYITRGRSPGILATANQSLFSNNELHVRHWAVAPAPDRNTPELGEYYSNSRDALRATDL